MSTEKQKKTDPQPENVAEKPTADHPQIEQDESTLAITKVTWVDANDMEISLEPGDWFLVPARVVKFSRDTGGHRLVIESRVSDNQFRCDFVLTDVRSMTTAPKDWPQCSGLVTHPDDKDLYMRCQKPMEHAGEHRKGDLVWVDPQGWAN